MTKSSATTIDLVFTNRVDNIASSGVVRIGITDHSVIYAKRNFSVPKTRPIIKEVQDLKNVLGRTFYS